MHDVNVLHGPHLTCPPKGPSRVQYRPLSFKKGVLCFLVDSELLELLVHRDTFSFPLEDFFSSPSCFSMFPFSRRTSTPWITRSPTPFGSNFFPFNESEKENFCPRTLRKFSVVIRPSPKTNNLSLRKLFDQKILSFRKKI